MTGDDKNPSGATMLARGKRIKDMCLDILLCFPATRGDHALAYIRVLQKYYHKQVRVETRPTLRLTYSSFKAFFYTPAFETVRRRIQEIQHDEKEKIWLMVAAKHPEFIVAYGNSKEWRQADLAIKTFLSLAKNSELLPTARTLRKRTRNENAHDAYFSDRQMGLDDFGGD